MTLAYLALLGFAFWCTLNTLHFVIRPLRLRRAWRREHKGIK